MHGRSKRRDRRNLRRQCCDAKGYAYDAGLWNGTRDVKDNAEYQLVQYAEGQNVGPVQANAFR